MEDPLQPPSPKDAATQVRDLMRSAGWTQAELARAIGVTQPTVSRWVSGKQEPNFQQTLALSYHSALNKSNKSKDDPIDTLVIVGTLDNNLEVTLYPKDKAIQGKIQYGIKVPHLIGVQIDPGVKTPFGEGGWIVLMAFSDKNDFKQRSYHFIVTENKSGLLRKVGLGSSEGLYHLLAPGLDPIVDCKAIWPFVVIGTISPEALTDLRHIGPEGYEFAY